MPIEGALRRCWELHKSWPFLFKMITLLFEFLTLIFIILVYTNPRYFKDLKCTPEQQNVFKRGQELAFDKGRGLLPPVQNCEAFIDGTPGNCDYYLEVYKMVKVILERRKKTSEETGVHADSDWDVVIENVHESCPDPLLLTIPFGFVTVTCVVSVFMMVTASVLGLIFGAKRRLITIDFCSRFIETGIFTVSSLLLIGMTIVAFTTKYPCSEALNNVYDVVEQSIEELSSGSGQRDLEDNGVSSRRLGHRTRNGTYVLLFKTCLEEKNDVYGIWFLLIGTISAVIASVLHGVTIYMMNIYAVFPEDDLGGAAVTVPEEVRNANLRRGSMVSMVSSTLSHDSMNMRRKSMASVTLPHDNMRRKSMAVMVGVAAPDVIIPVGQGQIQGQIQGQGHVKKGHRHHHHDRHKKTRADDADTADESTTSRSSI